MKHYHQDAEDVIRASSHPQPFIDIPPLCVSQNTKCERRVQSAYAAVS